MSRSGHQRRRNSGNLYYHHRQNEARVSAIATVAMSNLHDGEYENSTRQIIALWKLARLIAKSPEPVSRLIAYSIEALAHNCACQVAFDKNCPSTQLKLLNATIAENRLNANITAGIQYERFKVLDWLNHFGRRGPDLFCDILHLDEKATAYLARKCERADWRAAALEANRLFDAADAATRRDPFSSQDAAMMKMTQNLTNAIEKQRKPTAKQLQHGEFLGKSFARVGSFHSRQFDWWFSFAPDKFFRIKVRDHNTDHIFRFPFNHSASIQPLLERSRPPQ